MKKGRMNASQALVSMVLSLALLLVLRGHTLAQGWPCPFWGPGVGGMSGIFGWLGGIFMVAFWVLILVGIVRLIQWLGHAGRFAERQLPPPASESPIDILKRRYANGEITREQFEAMKQDLS